MNDVIYSNPLLPEYEGNPLIEALPSMGRTDKELFEAMKLQPLFAPEECSLPQAIRREMTLRLAELFIPLPIHFDLLEELSICVRRSYVWRNPLLPQTQAFLHHPGVSAIIGDLMPNRAASSHLLLVKGISGIGKSTAIEACLRALGPQVIRHTRYRDYAICETQIVWLKVSCPEDRSLKTLCLRILQAADAALGEKKYGPQYLSDPRITTGVLLNAVFQCLANEHVGVLAVDEVQNLLASKGQPAREMLNFLLRLKDEAGICLVMSGTYAALDLLNRKFRLARRIAGSEVELKLPTSEVDPVGLPVAYRAGSIHGRTLARAVRSDPRHSRRRGPTVHRSAGRSDSCRQENLDRAGPSRHLEPALRGVARGHCRIAQWKTR